MMYCASWSSVPDRVIPAVADLDRFELFQPTRGSANGTFVNTQLPSEIGCALQTGLDQIKHFEVEGDFLALNRVSRRIH